MSAAAPFVLVASGKGGVGKTTLAANLGLELARSGERVLLVDLDLGLANLNVLLRISPRLDVEDALAGRGRLEDCLVEGPLGVRLLPAASGSAELARGDAARRGRLIEELRPLSERFDFVLGDCPAGIGPDVLGFAACADHVLVVTTPEPAALTDAYGTIKALDAFGAERGTEIPTPELVLNLVSGVDEAEAVARKLALVCERFLARSPRLAGWLPRSSAVAAGGASQVPFAVHSRKSLEHHCLRRLAERIRQRFRRAPRLLGALKG